MLVRAATYGTPSRYTDVTAIVVDLVVNGILAIPTDLDLNHLFGDPARGERKRLRISLETGAGAPPRELDLPEHAGHLVDPVHVGAGTRTVWPDSHGTGRIACSYAYFEKNAHYRENLVYFLRHALRDEIDFVFVINGECSVDIPRAANVKVIERENVGFDFGGHSAAVAALGDSYDYYVFLNATVRGPFLPPYMARSRWTDPFLALLQGDTHLVGASIAVQYNFDWVPFFRARFGWDRQALPAVESYFFVLDRIGKAWATDDGVFDHCDESDFWRLVFTREIAMSISVLSRGGNIDCLIPEMRGVDYRRCLANFNPSHFTPTSPRGCFGRSLHPYETVFIKQNRAICDAEVASLTAYFDRLDAGSDR